MRTIKILDCTLRDGGFINDWNFSLGSIKSIISRLDKAGIDIVEVGFIDERRSYDSDRSIVPDTDSIRPMMQNLIIQNALIVAMIDFGTCSIEHISLQKNSCIDGIRVIFKKAKQDEAIAYCTKIKEKGYKIFVQPVSTTEYSDEEVVRLIDKINSIDPYSVSIVDTYGLMHNTELLHYFNLFDKYLKKEITIGYHSHNNFQVAYANSVELTKVITDRNLVLDSSLYGMGKGAGNANTELLAMYFNENYDKKYNVEQLLEAIDVDILKEYEKNKWGYSILYYISALNDCHPQYVKLLLDKKSLSIKSVNEIITAIPKVNKLTFNKELVENLYLDYQNKEYDDFASYSELLKVLKDRRVLLLGPGKTLVDQSKLVLDYIKENDVIVFSINFINDMFPINYVFMGNSKRYSQFFHKIYGDDSKCKVICTSNITGSSKKIDYTFTYSELCSDVECVRDNPLLMLLKILEKTSVSEVVLAGFDGYKPESSENYYNAYIPFLYCKTDVLLRNEAIKDFLEVYSKNIRISTLTPSYYLDLI